MRAFLIAFKETPRAARLVLESDRLTAFSIVVVGFVRALFPLAIAYVGKLLVDGVLLAAETGTAADRTRALEYVALELGLIIGTGLLAQLAGLLRTLLGTKLGYQINIRILEKALQLDLEHFENPEVYDKLQNARREASARPLNLFINTVDLVASVVTLASYAVVLFTFSGFTLLILLVATIPAFIVEAKFSSEAFRLFSWRAPEGRRMRYLEMVMTRDAYAKEVKLYGLGDLLMERYRGFYQKFFGEERSLAVRRNVWAFGLGLVSTTALYGCYAWVVARTITGALTLGDMTLYMAVFRQGQNSLRSILRSIGSTYEDNLFMSNLFAFLELPVSDRAQTNAPSPEEASAPRTGFVLEDVSFAYPGTNKRVLDSVSLTIGPEEKLAIVGENGAGKTTLIKLLTGLYQPSDGRITLDGTPLAEIPEDRLQARIGAVLQDFVRYQFTARDNVGLGQPSRLGEEDQIRGAADKGGALAALDELPEGLDTQLGRWFEGGMELSIGNWQKVAVSRAFMRDADVLILDEPTAALDAEAEHALFQRFRELTEGKMAILISHRFSTVRMADRILVLSAGKVEEIGSHEELLEAEGRYAHLFRLQASGYQVGPTG